MKNEHTGAGVAEPGVESRPGSSVSAGNGRGGDGRRADASATLAAEPAQTASRGVLREYFESLLVTAIMALFGMTFIVQAVKVPTGSMQNTILIGDHLLVNKFIFAPGASLPFLPQREIRRGDIIVFKYPGNPHNKWRDEHDPTSQPYVTNFVKRVIGLPGERVLVQGENVYVNGKLLAEHRVTARNPPGEDNDATSGDETGAPLTIESTPPASGDAPYTVYFSRETRTAPNGGRGMGASPDFYYAVNDKEAVVPADSYFVMGDNRENSLDSRAWGFVPRDLVIGRAMFVYWSYDTSKPASDTPPPFGLLMDFIENSRWSRTGTLVR